MSLAGQCRHHFAPLIRQCGDRYFAAGRVELGKVSGGAANARVSGSGGRTYRIRLEAFSGSRNHGFDMTCDCAYADGGKRCKHAWAVIRALDTDGWSDLGSGVPPFPAPRSGPGSWPSPKR